MPKKAALFLTLLVLGACVAGYRLWSAPVAQAKPRPAQEQVPESAATLPMPPVTWSLTGSSTYKQSASITKPAESGAQHVVTCIAFSMNNASSSKVSSTAILRNGPSLTGTPLWQYNFTLQPGMSIDHSVCNLNIVASVNTDVTFETNAYASTIGSFVNLVGYDAQ
jgi:hypothetical protein